MGTAVVEGTAKLVERAAEGSAEVAYGAVGGAARRRGRASDGLVVGRR